MNLRETFLQLKSRKEAALVAYITAGDPDLAATRLFVEALSEAGADIIELGIPFSDPIADGPVNQKAAERALKSGTTLRGVLDLVAKLRADGFSKPIVLFTYFNPVFRMGIETFAEAARKAGATGALIVDLPPEEADYLCKAFARQELETVFLASPTTATDRLPEIERLSTGFVYYVSRTGVTGARAELSASLPEELKRLRAQVRTPVAVGFGISTPEQARAVTQAADGVVVGSAFVNLIERNPEPRSAAAQLKALAAALKNAINCPPRLGMRSTKVRD